MTETGGDMVALRVSDADRNGTMRRLHNAVALGLINIDEFEQRSSFPSRVREASWMGWSVTCPGLARSSRPRPTGWSCAAGPAP